MIAMMFEPIHTAGLYDFGNSDLFAAARDIDIDTIWKLKDEYVLPSPKTAFFHRKLIGTFMLLSRIRARINVQDLIQSHLPGLRAASGGSMDTY